MEWAGPRNDAGVIPADTVAIGVEDDQGNIMAVVYYNHFTTYNCSMHVVSSGAGRWLTRGFLAAVFAYPFVQLKLNRVTAYVRSRNERALRLDTGIGFRFEGRMVRAAGDDDLIVLGMLRENCTWIPEEHRHG